MILILRELRKALCSYIFAGINVFLVYIACKSILNNSLKYSLIVMIVSGGLSIISVWFGLYQTYRWGLYIYYKKTDCTFKLTYDTETWKKFVVEETNRRLVENRHKIKEVLLYTPGIIIGLVAIYYVNKRKGDIEAAQNMLGAAFQNTMLIMFVGIILFVIIWYTMGPVLFYLENIRSSAPFVIANKRYVLLNGELYHWKNNKDSRIIERKILEGNMVQIKYQSSTARFNDVTFRFPIPNDKKTEVAKYIHML